VKDVRGANDGLVLELRSGARATIDRHEAHIDPDRSAVSRYVQAIVAVSRGQALVDGAIRSERIDVVLSARLSRRSLMGRYRGSDRQWHVCGLVLRDPKVYLVAAEADRTTGLVSALPKVFALDRFESIVLSDRRNDPPAIDLDTFVAAGCLEAPVRGRSPSGGPELIDIALRIHGLDADRIEVRAPAWASRWAKGSMRCSVGMAPERAVAALSSGKERWRAQRPARCAIRCWSARYRGVRDGTVLLFALECLHELGSHHVVKPFQQRGTAPGRYPDGLADRLRGCD